MPTIGCRVQRLRPGFEGAGRRHTASTIFNVVRGEGTTIVDGERLEWSQHDTFAVPGWTSYQHVNTSASADAVLFSYSDQPVMRSLGLYRTEDADPGA
ncbi:cupin domain-containing protein [Streptomyces sp. NPDC096191]|uniref:cupin domain-containing protein n=1 Tax=Streptomyces sp. NPDC096191 TaxID=3155426 RepID=UPI003331F4D4